MTKSECLSEFRSFQYSQMSLAFQRPYCVNKDLLVSAEKVLCVILKRLSVEELVQFHVLFGSIVQIK